MRVKITRVDKSLPLPEYHTKGSVGCDLYSRVDIKIKPKEVVNVPTNFIIQTPKGYMFLLASRSSTGPRKGLTMVNGVGIGDWDFSGPEDEYCVSFYNFSGKTVRIEKGERIAQGIFIKVSRAKWVESKPSKKSRGGFGSTGTHIK